MPSFSPSHQKTGAMVSTATLLLFLLSLTALALADNAPAGMIGINYGRLGNNLPTPSKVVSLLKSQGVTAAKIYDTDPSVLSAFSHSGISVVVNLPNELLSRAASGDSSYTDTWLKSNILPFYPATKISAIAVGNEVFADPNNTTAFLLPAMTNLHHSLQKLNLDRSIKISSPLALSALGSSYPPSSGSFKTDLVQPVIKPMLEFLRNTSSYLMINAYPFLAYIGNTGQISLDYALSRPIGSPVVDSGNGLRYTNLFDAQIDAVYAAMKSLQYDDVKVVVTETGWPSKGDTKETGASVTNAAAYNRNLVKKVLTGQGTPLKPKEPLLVYLFALFNENQKPGPTSERNFGLFYPDQKRVYDIPLTLAQLNSKGGVGAATAEVNNGSKVVVTAAPAPTPTGHTWCVAKGSAGKEKLQAALDYACGEGGADCRPIQPGAACYNPDRLEAHASYAFNSYYQMKSRGAGTCDFGGTAYVVTQPPRYGNCQFPTGYGANVVN